MGPLGGAWGHQAKLQNVIYGMHIWGGLIPPTPASCSLGGAGYKSLVGVAFDPEGSQLHL